MSFTSLNYHVVFSTKHGKPVIDGAIRERLYEYNGGIVRMKEGTLIEIGGVADHIHILAGCSPKMAITDWVRDIKANSARWMNELSKRKARFEWQKGYGAFTVTASQVDVVQKYIQGQQKHHKQVSFQEEFLSFIETAQHRVRSKVCVRGRTSRVSLGMKFQTGFRWNTTRSAAALRLKRVGGIFRGLTPTAIRCRRFATEDTIHRN